MDEMFRVATGWLGWTPDIALDTPLSQINLALAGKVDFLKKTNPWGSKEDTDESGVISRATKPEDVAGAMRTFVEAIGAKRLPKRKANG
jgi:hypothetical protein